MPCEHAASRGAGSRARRCGGVAKCLVVVTMMLPLANVLAQSPRPPVSLEYAVKATYLYKLAPFVDWPPGTFTSADAPFDICLLGRNPFGGFLEKAVAGRKLGTHPFRIRKLVDATPGAGCQIVFIGGMRTDKVREALQAFTGEPVLTVADSNTTSATGSVVKFVIRRGHVRFEVDNAAAVRNHLAISSKLLDLAAAVKDSD